MTKKHFPHFLIILTALLGYSVNLRAQQIPVPDCIIPFDTGAGAGAGEYDFPGGNGFDNRTVGCVTWTLEWQSSLSPTVTFQSSLGVASPTSYGAYTGTTVFSGAGIDTFSNLQTGTVVDTPWVRVDVVTASSGQTKGVLFGYRTGYTGGTGGGSGGGGSGGCAGTASTPCIVSGPDAQGASPTKNPVLVAGYDGSGVQRLQTDPTGHLENNQQGAGSFSSGQQSVTASATALSPIAASRNVLLCALSTNTISIFIGSSGVTTSNGLEIPPGQCRGFYLGNTDLVYVIASTTGATISWGFTD
jgi:hypothetical protein